MLFLYLLLIACLSMLANSRPDFDFESLRYRNLKAAKSHGDLLRRSNEIVTRKSIVLTYTEATYGAEDTTFASRVRLGGNRATLVLEEFDHLLELVECSGSSLTIEFRDATFSKAAKDACAELHGGLVISSHSSCSEAGAHSVFKVLDVAAGDGNNRMLFEVEQTTWREAFPSRKIEFGQTSDPHYLHRHDRLARRQDDTPASGVVASVGAGLIPTQTPDVESVTFDLANDQTETTFSWPAGVQFGPDFPITVGCKKCTTKGQLVLTQGEIDLTDLDTLTEQVIQADQEMDFIQSGFFQLELNGFETSILLKASPSASLNFAFDLFQVPVLGFKIPGFGAAGILFQPELVFDVSIKGGIEFTWGFNVTVPDKSTIRLDVGQFNNSRITGFDQTNVQALPFNANTSDIELTLGAGLRPFMPLGISFLGGDVKLLGGPFLDLPYISTNVTQLATTNANENCETGKGATSSKFQNAFKNLTHITSELGMGVGFEFEAEFSIVLDITKEYNYSIWSTSAPLPTACLAFGREGGFVQATAAAKSVGTANDLRKPWSCAMLVFGGLAALFAAI